MIELAGGDQIDRSQHTRRAGRHVFKISYRRGDYI